MTLEINYGKILVIKTATKHQVEYQLCNNTILFGF